LKQLQCPILVGMSRKSMLGAILGGAPVNERLFAGLSAATIAALNGAILFAPMTLGPQKKRLQLWLRLRVRRTIT
jgi:dihydropteroate synthase